MGWIGAMPVVRQWLGELDADEFGDYDFTVKNKDWAAATPINENDINDDQVGSLRMIPTQLVGRIMAHPAKLMFDLLINGDTALAYDAVAFFSNATGERTFDNLLAGTGTTLAQLEADLNAALVAMSTFTDDQGEPLDIQGTMIVCPQSLKRRFQRLVSSANDPTGTVDGTFNPYNDIRVMASARLDADDPNDWYLLATGEEIKPLVFSNRQEARPSMEKKNLTKTWIYSADYRGNGGYCIPALALKTVNV